MIVNSHNIEFGYELLSAVPYAYELYQQGKLTETISGKGSAPLYYFSPKHTITHDERSWFNTTKARKNCLPYTHIHTYDRPTLEFPPYKEVFQNDKYKWDKPTLVIANRYNVEWGLKPINYFDENILDWLFENLKNKYEIVYIAVDLPADLQDDNKSMPLNDRAIAKKHNVKVFQDIKCNCWNTSLLQVFANCEHYITMNGGYSILASLFGGTNIAYSKREPQVHAKELKYKEFFRYYPNHNNQRVLGVETYEALKAKVQAIYIDDLPCVNVLIRTSNRPNAFENCYNSVMNQDYPNINIVVSIDEAKGLKYTRGKDARIIDFTSLKNNSKKPPGDEYGIYFMQNLYLEEMQKRVHGYIIVLDDDDIFKATNAVSIIAEHLQKDKLTVWRGEINGKVLPSSMSFGKEIRLYDIGSFCFAYHTDHIKETDWTPWKRADYRTAKKLAQSISTIWIDSKLTKCQGGAGMGKRIDLLTNKNKYMKTVVILNKAIGQVGKVKRLPKPLAIEMVSKGYAKYLSENEPMDVAEKPKVAENKVLKTETENKNENPKPRKPRIAKPRKSKAVSKGNSRK